MRFTEKTVAITVATLVTVLLPAIVTAQSTGLDDIVGARAGQAEGELQRRGYQNIRGEKGTIAAIPIGEMPSAASALPSRP